MLTNVDIGWISWTKTFFSFPQTSHCLLSRFWLIVLDQLERGYSGLCPISDKTGNLQSETLFRLKICDANFPRKKSTKFILSNYDLGTHTLKHFWLIALIEFIWQQSNDSNLVDPIICSEELSVNKIILNTDNNSTLKNSTKPRTASRWQRKASTIEIQKGINRQCCIWPSTRIRSWGKFLIGQGSTDGLVDDCPRPCPNSEETY